MHHCLPCLSLSPFGPPTNPQLLPTFLAYEFHAAHALSISLFLDLSHPPSFSFSLPASPAFPFLSFFAFPRRLLCPRPFYANRTAPLAGEPGGECDESARSMLVYRHFGRLSDDTRRLSRSIGCRDLSTRISRLSGLPVPWSSLPEGSGLTIPRGRSDPRFPAIQPPPFSRQDLEVSHVPFACPRLGHRLRTRFREKTSWLIGPRKNIDCRRGIR